MNVASGDPSRAAGRWLSSLGLALWIVAALALAMFHYGVETVVSRNEAFLRDLPSEHRSERAFRSLPALHSQLRLARSLSAIAFPAALVAIFLVRRFRGGISGGILAAGSGLFVAACSIAGLLWAVVVATTPV